MWMTAEKEPISAVQIAGDGRQPTARTGQLLIGVVTDYKSGDDSADSPTATARVANSSIVGSPQYRTYPVLPS